MNNTQGATKQDLQELELRMNKAMEGFVQEILSALSPEFQSLKEDVGELKQDVGGLKGDVRGLKQDVRELREDVDELKLTTSRIERKLDATIERVDDHGKRIRTLEVKAIAA